MLIDCDSCVMRNIACSDCVVTALLGPMPNSIDDHKQILEVLAHSGLVAPLRLIKGEGKDVDLITDKVSNVIAQ
jgi:hypothetical protein